MSPRAVLFAAMAVLVGAGVAAQEIDSESPLGAPEGAAPAAVAEPVRSDLVDAAEVFVNANSEYESGDHEQAIGLYTTLLDRGVDDGRVHYNLGNAYLRHGELGRAIADYRRALAQRPRDRDVEANLAFARKSAKDAIDPPRNLAVLETLFFWHYELSRAELAWVALICNLLLWAALAVRIFRPGSELLRWSAIVFLLVLLATGSSLVIRTAAPDRVAVIVPEEVEVRTGPGEDALVRFKLHAGSELRVHDQREGWVRIELPDGKSGWLPREQVEVVEL